MMQYDEHVLGSGTETKKSAVSGMGKSSLSSFSMFFHLVNT